MQKQRPLLAALPIQSIPSVVSLTHLPRTAAWLLDSLRHLVAPLARCVGATLSAPVYYFLAESLQSS